VLAEHFKLSVACHGEKLAGRLMRKFGIKFSRHHPDADAVKDAFVKVTNLDEWHAALDRFYRDSDESPVAVGSAAGSGSV